MQSVCRCFINGITSFVFDENNYGGFQKFICQISMSKKIIRLQTTQHTSDGAVTADTNCWANCVETSRPQQWGRFTVFWASRPCEPVGWLTLLLIKSGDVETNPGPTTSHKRIRICDIFYNLKHVRKPISIKCNRIEHWVHLRCAGIRQQIPGPAIYR